MNKQTVFGIMLTLLITSVLTWAFNVQLVSAGGTIYIRPDGSIDPPHAPIERDGDVYTFTGNIYDSIVVERDNIVVNGAGYTINGIGLESREGIVLSGRSNVTVKNTEIKVFEIGIYLDGSSGNTISHNNITENYRKSGIQLRSSRNNNISYNNIINNYHYWSGIYLVYSSNNIISGNNIADNEWYGVTLSSSSQNNITENRLANCIYLIGSSGNNISGNNIITSYMLLDASSNNALSYNNITNGWGVRVWESSGSNISHNNIVNNSQQGISFWLSNENTIFSNTLANNEYGILTGPGNVIYHNNFINNINQVYSKGVNIWDDGYPSGGNYWSDYEGADVYLGPGQNITGKDGIGDEPYVIDEENQDNYPLMKPYVPGNLSISIYTDKYTYHAGDTMNLGLNVTNPDSVKYVCFAVWCELPDSSIYLLMHEHSVILPIGFSYANPNFKSFILPTLPSGKYTWRAAFLERATHTIIVEDTAEWEFN